MIRYYKLFDLLNRKGMKKTDLLKIISSKTLAKLSKGETITTDIINKICIFLNCQPKDIMEFIDQEHNGIQITTTEKDITEKEIIQYKTEDIERTHTIHGEPLEIRRTITATRDKETKELIEEWDEYE